MTPKFELLAAKSFWDGAVELLTTPSLQLFLLLGGALLLISFLLLTTTRLGHAKPITKCVVLSVIAHILLIGYAYGTRLIFQFPVAQQPPPIRVNWIEGDDEIQPDLAESPRPLAEFIDSVRLTPEPIELVRPELDSPFELERTVEFPETDLRPDRQAGDIPKIEIAKLEAEQPHFNIAAPDIPFDTAEPGPKELVEPQLIELQRRGEAENEQRDFQPPRQPDEPTEPSEELTRVDIQPEIINAESFPGEEQRVKQFESELVLPAADGAITEEFAVRGSQQPSPPEASGRDLQPQELVAVPVATRRLGDGALVPEILMLRGEVNRKTAALQRGGNEQTEAAVDSALLWLSQIQCSDGRWDPKTTSAGREDRVYGHDRGACGADAEMGITALATLAFLGAGHNHLEGAYAANVQKALEYLLKNQRRDGDLSGNARLFARMYCHSMALFAISEALAISGDRRLEDAVRRGVSFSIQAQDKSGGGWRYQPGDAGDMSQLGWQVMALHSASLGGIEVDPSVVTRMRRFLQSCRSGKDGGLASYRPGEGPSTSMTAEALVCEFFLTAAVPRRLSSEAQQRILAEMPQSSRPNYYYWYYATLAMYQSGGAGWLQWNSEIQRVLLSQQEVSGENAGSWPPNGLWCGYGGRVYSTALATMCLQVYYRYMPNDSAANFQAAIPLSTR